MTNFNRTAYYRELKDWVKWWYAVNNVRKIPDHLKIAIKSHARHWAEKGFKKDQRTREKYCADLIEVHVNEIGPSYRFVVNIDVPALNFKEAYDKLTTAMSQIYGPLSWWETVGEVLDPKGDAISQEEIEEARMTYHVQTISDGRYP